ncbi:MAG TPA: hypothetical protein VGX91_02625 [Candidatus Cybelea sp.]|jgi:hypothetical protein|nr:hypothetical protein [Candidatus Cybelea sp.]
MYPLVGRFTLAAFVASFVFAGCGGSQPLPSSASAATQARIARTEKSGDLLYASTQSGNLYVTTFPQGKYVGIVGVSGGSPIAICSDKHGNVFVPVQTVSSGTIYEFAHGGTSPIDTLSDPQPPMGCSVDPTTGNLAVANGKYGLAVYADAQGQPTMYDVAAWACTYDDKGNLFIDSAYNVATLYELPKDGQLQSISLNERIGEYNDRGTSVQWDGKYLAITYLPQRGHGSATVYQVAVSGSSGTVENAITLDSKTHNQQAYTPYTWSQDGSIAIPVAQGGRRIALYGYPRGGSLQKSIAVSGSVLGETVSVGK